MDALEHLVVWLFLLLIFTAPVWGWLLLKRLLCDVFGHIDRQREQRNAQLADQIARRFGK